MARLIKAAGPMEMRDAFDDNPSTPLVSTVLNTISQDYYRKVPRGQLIDQGLVAMVASLKDPYSHYYSPSAYQAFLNQSGRRFHGIGVDVVPAWSVTVATTTMPPMSGAGSRLLTEAPPQQACRRAAAVPLHMAG